MDLKHAAAMMQRELLEKQRELRAQDGFRERLRSFARQLADAEDLPEPAMRAVVRGVRAELVALGQPESSDDAGCDAAPAVLLLLLLLLLLLSAAPSALVARSRHTTSPHSVRSPVSACRPSRPGVAAA